MRLKTMSLSYAVLAGLMVTGSQSFGRGPCSDCNPTKPGDVNGCWHVVESLACTANLAKLRFVRDEPTAFHAVGGTICDACGTSVDQTATVTYSKTTGWSFGLTVTAGVEWKVPIGPNWHVDVQGNLRYDTTTTTAVSQSVNCNAGGVVGLVVLERYVPYAVHADLRFSNKVLFEREVPVPPQCTPAAGPGLEYNSWVDATCKLVHQTTNATLHEYRFRYDDLICPELPIGGLGG